MKSILYRFGLVLMSTPLVVAIFAVNSPVANAATSTTYNPNYLIADNIFTDYTSMSASAIQTFLVNEGSGLQNYSAVEDCGSTSGPHYAFYSTYYSCGSSEPASTIIYDASQAYQINPMSILATMEKEQSLITDPSPSSAQLNCAMGYYSCGQDVGFFYQVDGGTWQFRADINLMTGQNYWGYTPSQYPCATSDTQDNPVLYSNGLYPGNTVTFSNPPYPGDPAGPNGYPETLNLANASTATLYCYTPYVGPYSQTGYSGSYNFDYYFELWFGSVASPCYNTTELNAPTGASILKTNTGSSADNLVLTLANGTGSACAEAHIWNPGFQSFMNDYATNLPVFDPTSTGQIISAKNLYGNGQNNFIYVKYQSTGSGNIEIHVWNPSLNGFQNDYVTNLASAPPSDGEVISGDFYGNGQDELAYVKYQNTGSGKVEVHIWNSNYSGFLNDYATNVAENPPSIGQVITANLNGSGPNTLIYVVYQDSGSGKVEVHIWNSNYSGFLNDYATNVGENPPNVGQVLAADVYGTGRDNLIYSVLEGSGSGKVEVHIWNSNYSGFLNDYATNVPDFTNN